MATVDDLDTMVKAVNARDDDGYNEAMRNGFYLHTGQRVRVIEIKIFEEEYHLRVLSGSNVHKACWTDNGYAQLFKP